MKLIINNRTLNQYVNPMYRVCNLYKETIDYNTVAALNLSKVWVHSYIDAIRRPLTSTGIICKDYDIKVTNKWYEHTPETVTENEHETWTIQLSSATFQLIPIKKSNTTGRTSLPCPWSKTKCWRSACWLIWLYPLNEIHLSKCLNLKRYQSMRSKYQRCGTFLPVAIWALGLVEKGLGK